jgi:hypothetical protein
VTELGHLARRFFGSLSRQPPSASDEAWAEAAFRPGELAIWRRLSNVDRRHAIEVARRFAAARVMEAPAAGDLPRAELAGVLLHDCGKLDSGLGTFRRVGATVWLKVRGAQAAEGDGRIARYARHEEIGAAMLQAAGSDPSTVALVGRTADAPELALAALAAADHV